MVADAQQRRSVSPLDLVDPDLLPVDVAFPMLQQSCHPGIYPTLLQLLVERVHVWQQRDNDDLIW